MEQSYEFITSHSTLRWAHNFLHTLKCAGSKSSNYQYITMGLGLNWQVIQSKKGFKELNNQLLINDYIESNMRLIVIDEDEVIPQVKNSVGVYEPQQDALNALHELTKDPKNILFIVSSREKEELHRIYHEHAPKTGLAAENGFFWQWIGEKWH
jgi:hypothetical protein